MSLSQLLARALEITSTFNLEITLILFLLCAVGEIGFALPYILETIWLLAGYNLAHGILSWSDLLLIWIVAQLGRQTGSLVLYYSGVLGMAPLKRLYRRFIEPRMPKRTVIPAFISNRIINPSPLSVAIGRLVGLRIPMALTASARQKLYHLVLGVVISSLIWDGIYIVVGMTVGRFIRTEYMALYSVGGLTILYLIILSIRYFIKSRSGKNKVLESHR